MALALALVLLVLLSMVLLLLINPQAAVSLSFIDQLGTNILARTGDFGRMIILFYRLPSILSHSYSKGSPNSNFTGIDLTGKKQQTEWVKKVKAILVSQH